MGLEIERKWLINFNDLPIDFVESGSIQIRQGYVFANKDCSLRIRESISGSFPSWTMTVKVGQGLSRTEIENNIDQETFEELWGFTEGSRIEKFRFLYGDNLEIDMFLGNCNGLMIVEREFSNKDEALIFKAPWWFGQEVTFDGAYTNAELSKKGWEPNGTD